MPNLEKAGRETIVVGMSGGVDSAVAALLLTRAGFDVHGLYMSNWDDDDDYCTDAQDFQDARATAGELGIPLHRVSFAEQYRARVFDYFLTEYRAGRTPNPDVLCNREIKFGVCLDYAARLGARRFATGHYARLVQSAEGPQLHKASDADKDQSYFLHAVDGEHFEHVLFPLGELRKSEVRTLAREAGLPVFDKPDSTGICFIGERPFREFLQRYIPTTPGDIVTETGEIVGQHRGLAFYTLGQRGGLEIGGRSGKSEDAWYVAAKDLAHNQLVAVQGNDHPLLSSRALLTGPCNWLVQPASPDFHSCIKVRYRQSDQTCHATIGRDGSVEVRFMEPQRAVTPGQFAVFYDGDRCLGGGVIERTWPHVGRSPHDLRNASVG
ncbi:MAG TPA: tRNA 2-thiouridine(34) synthase MnmA [Steroidobacteraceae bacterium]|nr:tRNA 2-thiouridine(34) synthase MnmA [Steroidobacteraceae bacterium]